MSANQLIKQSLAYRAKYMLDAPKAKVISPLLVVPHPQNRSGDAVKSLRTKQLIGTLVTEGYDTIEANSNGVVVEQGPAVAGEFQHVFSSKLKADTDMADQLDGMVATSGSLSHSHLNCCMRNILAGKFGCECPEYKQKCTCASSPILDDNGNYCLEKLKKYDAAWAMDCQTGLTFERLSYKMDEEEPTAALVISIALNKRNETAMKTGHLEIMSTLVSLCKPDPKGHVHFDPVRDKLVDLYGAAIDDPDFVHAFRVVCDAGGLQAYT